jgi:hypothetical protein
LISETGVPSDAVLIHYVRLAHYAECVCDAFGYNSTQQTRSIPDEHLQFYVRSFDSQLENLKSQIPPFLAKDSMLSTSIVLVTAYTREIGLHGLSSSPTTLSIHRTTILIDCLSAVKSVLDIVTTLPETDFRYLMGSNWARIHYTLEISIELSLGIESPSWSIEFVRGIIALETYIDIFTKRLEHQSSLVNKKAGESDWFQFLATQWAGLRHKYVDGMRARGIGVEEEVGLQNVRLDGWPGLDEMDFMPNEWFWMAQPEGAS